MLLGPVLALSLPPEPPYEFKIVANCIKDQDCYFSIPTKTGKLGIMIIPELFYSVRKKKKH